MTGRLQAGTKLLWKQYGVGLQLYAHKEDRA